ELNYYRIRPERWWASDNSVPAAKGIRRFLQIMDNPANYPVLVHCFAGIHRSGAYCAVYRMEYEHWSKARAIAEMKACGYCNIGDEWDLLGYLEEYQPRWLQKQKPVGHPAKYRNTTWRAGSVSDRRQEKSEIRNPKSETNPNHRRRKSETAVRSRFGF